MRRFTTNNVLFYRTEKYKKSDCELTEYYVPDAVWSRIKHLVPKRKRGVHAKYNQQKDYRVVMGAILATLYSQDPWDTVMIERGVSPSLAYKTYVKFKQMGIFKKIAKVDFSDLNEFQYGIEWQWLNIPERFIRKRRDATHEDNDTCLLLQKLLEEMEVENNKNKQ